MRVTREFLVCFDYGTGGLWAVVIADSADQIKGRYPEVSIAPERPPWMDDATYVKLRRDLLVVDRPEDQGIFKAVVEGRSK